MSLKETQEKFINGVLKGDEGVVPLLAPGGGVPAEARMRIYRNNTNISLADVLFGVFPILAGVIGDESFKCAVAEFVKECPPSSGNVNDYGAEFPEFLKRFSPSAGIPYLSDIALFEWFYYGAHFGEKRKPLSVSKLQKIKDGDFPKLKFSVSPEARVLGTRYPVLELWEGHYEGRKGNVELKAGEERFFLIYSRQRQPRLMEITAEEKGVLEDVSGGATFYSAIENNFSEEHPLEPGELLQKFIREEVFVGFELA